MKLKYCNPDDVKKIFKENLGKENVFFVFATDVSLSSWAEWCVKNPQESGKKTVCMEQFLAWDNFKEQFVAASEKGKHAIPSLLKKFFVYDLIRRNSENKNDLIFKSIINPQYAENAFAFAPWISSNISSLEMWHQHYEKWLMEKNISEVEDEDEENQDYLKLYSLYKEFLGDTMFEPSWISPDFCEKEKQFIIFYPEQMQDFEEYKNIFSASDNITLVQLPEKSEFLPEIYSYPDARMELRRTVLQIRNLIQKKVSPQDIALHVPQLDEYIPYLKREFSKYGVPFIIRSGQKMTVNSAGSIFGDIKNCYANNFSYDSVRALLLNNYVSWKEPELNQRLIKLGNEYHCLVNYDESSKKDVWKISLNASSQDELELKFYNRLKDTVKKMCNASSFSALRKAWFNFKEDFLDEDFSEMSDKVLSRCIKSLEEMVQIEEDYFEDKNLKISSPYDFFYSELQESPYRPQEQICGVNIFNYKLGAFSSYKYNFVINCSQSAVDISYKPVSFLNAQKRAALNFIDNNKAGVSFIRLYAKNNQNEFSTIFSYSEQSFSGFAIPHNFFKNAEISEKTPFEFLDKEDFILNERNFFLDENESLKNISDEQNKEFEIWKEKNESLSSNSNFQNDENIKSVKETVDFVLKEKRSSRPALKSSIDEMSQNEMAISDKNILKITQSDLSKFFTCKRKWLLKDVLKLKEDTLDLNLFDDYTNGNINHKIFEILFKKVNELPVSYDDGTFGSKQKEIYSLLEECFDQAIDDYKFSPLSFEVLKSHKEKFVQPLFSFLIWFCNIDRYGNAQVVSAEKWYCSKDENLEYALSGKIDCILAKDDKIIIIDYKNSSIPTQKSCKADEDGIIENFQCAVYTKLWNNNHEKNNVEKMSFTSFNEKKEAVIFDSEKKSSTPEKYESTVLILKDYTDYFFNSVSNKNFVPVIKENNRFNLLDVYSDCVKCDFKSICRTNYTVGRKIIESER